MILGDDATVNSNMKLSIEAASNFSRDENVAWMMTFGKSASKNPCTPDNIRKLIAPDIVLASSDAATPAGKPSKRASISKEEIQRRNKRALYFKNLEKLHNQRYS